MNIDGRIDNFVDQSVSGWLFDRSRVDRKVSFCLEFNSIRLGSFTADIFREDLKSHGIGDGCHAFQVQIPAFLLSKGDNIVRIISIPERQYLLEEVHFYGGKEFPDKERIKTSALDHLALEFKYSREDLERAISLVPNLDQLSAKPKVYDRNGDNGSPASASRHSNATLVREILALANLQKPQIIELAQVLFKKRRYEDVLALLYSGREYLSDNYTELNLCGRSFLSVNDYNDAEFVLHRLYFLYPKKHAAIFYYGQTLARLKKHTQALAIFEHCIALADDARYRLEAGRSAVWLAFGGYGAKSEKEDLLAVAINHLEVAAARDSNSFQPLRELSPLYIGLGQISKGVEVARQAVACAPRERTAWSTLSKAYIRQGDLAGAIEASRNSLQCDPKSDAAKFELKIIERISYLNAKARIISYVCNDIPSQTVNGFEFIPFQLTGSDLNDFLVNLPGDFVCFNQLANEEIESTSGSIFRWNFPWVGAITSGSARPLTFWRRGLLLSLLKAFDFDQRMDINRLVGLATNIAAYAPFEEFKVVDLKSQIEGNSREQNVILLSQHGIRRFGGAEQFLYQMAQLYAELGNNVLIVGTRPEYQGQSGRENGIAYTYIDESPESLLRLLVINKADIVHVVSGLGYEVAATLQWTRVKSIFGIHFWREVYYHKSPSPGYFPDIDRQFEPRPEFTYILSGFDAIYCNSVYTQQLIERDFGVRCPILYSLPLDDIIQKEKITQKDRKIVLLANARFDKGFDIFLAVAGANPEGTFIAIASQSDKAIADAEVEARKLSNVEIITRVEDMTQIYSKCVAVLVPSFKFVETFSRVVIEAQRMGIPVVGSDRGNVPLLLSESGVILTEDASAWSEEISRLYQDSAYWEERSLKAIANSALYGFNMQKTRLGRLISNLDSPFLIGVGSGLGNVLHTTPLIACIARFLNRRVDVVIAGDYSDLLFIVSNSKYVNHAFLLNDISINRRYETVLLTQSFGTVEPSFAARRVLRSRDWEIFKPDSPIHETEFNFAAAKALVGVKYQADDLFRYFVGEMKYQRPGKILVGMHGGSKDGAWATKRWPYFPELAATLNKRGWECVSFGVASEYIPGTINKCGGSIEEMAKALMQCSHFVSNDSGVMNLANALGIPLVALFGPTNSATRGPLSPQSISISVNKSCAPCEMTPVFREARFLTGTCDCLKNISVSDVVTRLDTLPLQV